MCGIYAVFNGNGGGGGGGGSASCECRCKNGGNGESIRELAYRQSGKQRHRGPDNTGVAVYDDEGVALVHERLEVVCPTTGVQPLQSADGQIVLVANGEIYNYLEIAAELAKRRGGCYTPRGDCDVILGLYEEYGVHALDHMTGMFAFVIFDRRDRTVFAARDPFGIIPLYWGRDESPTDDGSSVWFASEMKCLVETCATVEWFPPGHYVCGKPAALAVRRFYEPPWMDTVPTVAADLKQLREHLECAVRSHLQCDAPFGALLSGGVDSSLIASIATRVMRERDPTFRLKTFSVGLANAPDFAFSQMVADHIGSDHAQIEFTVDEGLDTIRNIIYHLETYDITTIRASIPMYILARHVKSQGLKMVLSGEGADEIFGGYLYFHSAPTDDELHRETASRVLNLHLSDCLRANKSMLAWGVELRVPFLDTAFVDHAMAVRPGDRIPGVKNRFAAGTRDAAGRTTMEKYILRAAFDDGGYLPAEVLWRQKEQFSDGVGYSWIDTIRGYASARVTDDELACAAQTFPHNTPATKEALYYRKVFAAVFASDASAHTVAKWVPRTDWGCSSDPSGRAQNVHQAKY